ncbi:MAG: DDE domain-containing protein [Mesorhizobium sp.]|uniref:DDE-type integrase/transposase/recombinase n=1 Tax=Mesorhizobium sp. TaxID=1871066 RepID=UPI000FE6FC9A|nr:MAG: DDE domain-containing protein [Mesorhizobium sp.]TIO49089.1 MAG: DDE domain-containing protein [Mesorhizobium sp.]TIO57182.1 MAG: DDE domain-containing protein [Mesorhizobium sp.]TJV59308.1 MAG: DDE domain-containing protein [Mesorhizobium sp.]
MVCRKVSEARQWMYFYRAIDCVAEKTEFWLAEPRDLSTVQRFFRRTLEHHCRPDREVINGG